MPFVSDKQRKWMHGAESRGEVPEGTAKKWESETKKSVLVKAPVLKYGQLIAGAGMLGASVLSRIMGALRAGKATRAARRTQAGKGAKAGGRGLEQFGMEVPEKPISPPKAPLPPDPQTTQGNLFKPSEWGPTPDPLQGQMTLAGKPAVAPLAREVSPPAAPEPVAVTEPASAPAPEPAATNEATTGGGSKMRTALEAAGTTALLTSPATGVQQNPAVANAQQNAQSLQQQHNVDMQQQATQAAGTTSGTQPGVEYGTATAKSQPFDVAWGMLKCQ